METLLRPRANERNVLAARGAREFEGSRGGGSKLTRHGGGRGNERKNYSIAPAGRRPMVALVGALAPARPRLLVERTSSDKLIGAAKWAPAVAEARAAKLINLLGTLAPRLGWRRLGPGRCLLT